MAGLPVCMLSNTTTSCPSARRASTRLEAMNPAPPVTNMLNDLIGAEKMQSGIFICRKRGAKRAGHLPDEEGFQMLQIAPGLSLSYSVNPGSGRTEGGRDSLSPPGAQGFEASARGKKRLMPGGPGSCGSCKCSIRRWW